jgi:hypothetical protein
MPCTSGSKKSLLAGTLINADPDSDTDTEYRTGV